MKIEIRRVLNENFQIYGVRRIRVTFKYDNTIGVQVRFQRLRLEPPRRKTMRDQRLSKNLVGYEKIQSENYEEKSKTYMENW